MNDRSVTLLADAAETRLCVLTTTPCIREPTLGTILGHVGVEAPVEDGIQVYARAPLQVQAAGNWYRTDARALWDVLQACKNQ